MSIEIKVPTLPESVADASIATWHKKPGDSVKRDENIVDIETDKVVLEVVAPSDGRLEKIIKEKGAIVHAEEVIALFEAGSEEISKRSETLAKPATENTEQRATSKTPLEETKAASSTETLAPAARRAASEKGVDVSQLKGSRKNGRITKEDVLKVETGNRVPPQQVKKSKDSAAESLHITLGERTEKRVPMTRLRARIAERLIMAQQTAAILTTFNEINMQPIMNLRQKYKDLFEKTYGVRLGFMSFFTLAVVEALKQFPIINASIDGNDIVYHGYIDIGIAVSSPRGLVVPILRNVEDMSMADIEKMIAQLGKKAKQGELTIEEITGGTFTISNGGVFGSLMSTPILNPPQTGILGMHKIEERAVVENGQIVIRPMMYVALSYDHRVIDGSESVRFLVAVKELLEEPARLAMGI